METGSQEQKECSNSQRASAQKSNLVSTSSISLPKGGGAIRGIGEKFAPNPVTGKGSISVLIANRQGRSGFAPQAHDLVAGNPSSDVGWNFSPTFLAQKINNGVEDQISDVAHFVGGNYFIPVFYIKLKSNKMAFVREDCPLTNSNNQIICSLRVQEILSYFEELVFAIQYLKTRYLFLLLVVFINGCVLHGSYSDHYFGPVFFRYSAPPISKAYVDQIFHFGILAEVGKTCGLTLGVLDRVEVSPILGDVYKKTENNSWQVSQFFSEKPPPNQWNFSLLYLRVDRANKGFFIDRTIKGVEILVGKEHNLLNIGYANKTLLSPPENAFSKFQYNQNNPLNTQAIVWFDTTTEKELPVNLLQEIRND